MFECDECDKEYSSRSGYRYHLNNNPGHISDECPECPTCSRGFVKLGQHWRQSSCKYPELTDEQRDVVTGILMGDGTIMHHSNDSQKSRFRVTNTNTEYLDYIDDLLGILSCGVKLEKTAEESAENNRYYGFRPDAKASNYQDIYTLTTRGIPDVSDFNSWYKEDGKTFPDELELTPEIVKHWYVCDGNYDPDRRRIKIACSNEEETPDKLVSYFEDIEIETNFVAGSLRFTVGSTKELFEYMGDSVPGFEYKWPEYYRK